MPGSTDAFKQGCQFPHLVRMLGVDILLLSKVVAKIVKLTRQRVARVAILQIEPFWNFADSSGPGSNQHPIAVPQRVAICVGIVNERASQAAAMLIAATTDAGSTALLNADLSAAQALTDSHIERAGAAARSETLARSLDQMRDSVKAAEEAEHRIVGSSVAVGASFSVGYVIWLLRGGVLATSLLSSLPAWRFVDPLPVVVPQNMA